MKQKYHIKSKKGIDSFTLKDEFLRRCTMEFKKNKKGNIQYSFDFGKTWSYILNFPVDRERIEREKKIANHPEIKTSRNVSKSGWGTYLFYILVFYVGLTIVDKTLTPIGFIQKFNSELFGSVYNEKGLIIDGVSDKENESTSFTEENSVNGEELTESEYSGSSSNTQSESSTYSYDNSSTENYEEQTQQKLKCRDCNGTGKCRECNKVFRTKYWGGKYSGWKNGNETRPGQIMCSTCQGSGVIYGSKPIGQDDPEMKSCYNSSCKSGWQYCRDCNSYGNGKNLGQCNECKGTGYKN